MPCSCKRLIDMSFSDDSEYSLRSRKRKMVPYVSSSHQHFTTEDTLESFSNLAFDGRDEDVGKIQSFRTSKEEIPEMVALEDTKVNGAAPFVPLLDPGGEGGKEDGKIFLQCFINLP